MDACVSKAVYRARPCAATIGDPRPLPEIGVARPVRSCAHGRAGRDALLPRLAYPVEVQSGVDFQCRRGRAAPLGQPFEKFPDGGERAAESLLQHLSFHPTGARPVSHGPHAVDGELGDRGNRATRHVMEHHSRLYRRLEANDFTGLAELLHAFFARSLRHPCT